MYMYTPEGNKEVAKAVKALKGAIRFELVKSNKELANAVKTAVAVVERTHPEVTDTEPRDYIRQEVLDFVRAHGSKWFNTDRYLKLF
jgi:hypothetical protein